MPSIPYLVYGTVRSKGLVDSHKFYIEFTNSSGSKQKTFFSSHFSHGKYIFDLANISYSNGETISYVAQDEFNNENNSGTFTVSGQNKELNLILTPREISVDSPGNKDVQIYNVGGKPVSDSNPFPIKISEPDSNVWKTYSQDFAGAQTNKKILEPQEEGHLEIHSLFVSTNCPTAGNSHITGGKIIGSNHRLCVSAGVRGLYARHLLRHRGLQRRRGCLYREA